MKETIYFTEKQKFNQWWLWLLLIAITLFAVYSATENPEHSSTAEICFSVGIPVLLIVFFAVVRLETQINNLGVSVRFYPVQITFRYYPWKNIQKAYVRTYSPLFEYGGWGMRGGLFGKGKAYNVKGETGLQLIFQDKKKLLIGTQKAEELQKILNEYAKK